MSVPRVVMLAAPERPWVMANHWQEPASQSSALGENREPMATMDVVVTGAGRQYWIDDDAEVLSSEHFGAD